MASGMTITFRPATIRANAGGSKRDRSHSSVKDSDRRPESRAWWSPLFGWGSEPDYIETPNQAKDNDRRKSAPRLGLLTEEKARELRMRLMQSESFHDAMYHSSISARLASEVSRGAGCNNQNFDD